MKLPKIEESPVSLKLFCLEGSSVPFIPWQRNERGQQVFIKLTRAEEVALLFVGENCLLDAELQQTLIRLVNEGWKVEGELTASFEGSHEPGIDPYVYQDPIVLELGKGLLPLLDPQQGAPLLGALPQVSDEIARESGLVPAGVRLKDNLRLGANQYTVLLKSSPIASGEIYLDRFLAIGSFEQLSALEGWATVEPTYRMQAKWVSADLQEKAKKMGCVLVGPLQVLLTHLKSLVLGAAPELLGLQDTYNLLARLQITHPVVVEEFMQDRSQLRALRKVLQGLLQERVALNNLVTILEVVGDKLQEVERPSLELLIEECRLALARQICWSNLNPQGELSVIVTTRPLEEKIARLSALRRHPEEVQLSEELVQTIIASIKEALNDGGGTMVIVTDPQLRPFLAKLLALELPSACVLSTTEVALGRAKLIITARASLQEKDAAPAAPSNPPQEAREPQDKEKEELEPPSPKGDTEKANAENGKGEGLLGFLRKGQKK